MFADALFRGRDWIATVPAVVVMSVLLSASLKHLADLREDDSALAVTLYEEEAPPPPPEPQPPQPRVREEPAKAAPVQPQPPVEPVDPRAIEPTAPPREVAPPPPPRETVVPPVPPAAAPVRVPPPVAAAVSVESTYVGRLRAYLEGIKRYPTSREARLQRPQGKVRLWIEIARDGRFRDAGIDRSSGSMILDGAALSTARQGTYPDFPEAAFAGRASQRFTVALDYQLEAD